MAKRITKLFQKDLQGNFDSEHPIRIGSSAQYITVSENDDTEILESNAEFLKERLDVIGNPDDLIINRNIERDNQNYNTIITYLNNIGPKANSIWNGFDGKLNTSGGTMSGNIIFYTLRDENETLVRDSDIEFNDIVFERDIIEKIGPLNE